MISTIYIAKNVYGGDGLGRLGDGRVAFVPGAWAGEQVRAEIVEEKKHFVKARLIEVVEASADRVPAKYNLPGMVYEGLSYEAELKAKTEQLREFFDRARLKVETFHCSPSPSTYTFLNYRNKVVYHFANQGGKWVIGYRKEPSHEILDVTEDPLARPEINAKLGEIRRGIMMLLTTGPVQIRRETERKGNVTIRWTAKTGVKWWIGEPPKSLVLREQTCGLEFEVPADGFYQVNHEVGEALAQAVVEEYQKGADLAPDILDLYCGVGVFGLCCLKAAPAGARLVGIESGRQAIDFAKKNASALRPSSFISPPSFYAEQVGKNLKRIPVSARTSVIIDPPRGGLEPGVAKWLAASAAPRVFYVSCDPATLTRDLKELVQSYDVESVRFFNMFPRTARFETFRCSQAQINRLSFIVFYDLPYPYLRLPDERSRFRSG